MDKREMRLLNDLLQKLDQLNDVTLCRLLIGSATVLALRYHSSPTQILHESLDLTAPKGEDWERIQNAYFRAHKAEMSD